jgi:PAS domain S-box-containing protein
MPYATPTPFATAAPLAAQPAVPAGADEPTPELPPCEAGLAAALIGLDGRFQRLDDAFSSLLGCREDELRAARWPSIIDRDNLKAHQEIARALRAGEIESAEIETIYMHAGGLLVPVEGTITVRRDAGGEPTHFLFRADVRRTSGASR